MATAPILTSTSGSDLSHALAWFQTLLSGGQSQGGGTDAVARLLSELDAHGQLEPSDYPALFDLDAPFALVTEEWVALSVSGVLASAFPLLLALRAFPSQPWHRRANRLFSKRLDSARFCIRCARAVRPDLEPVSATTLRAYLAAKGYRTSEWPAGASDTILNAVFEALVEEAVTVRVSPWAYLRAMWNLFWSALRHPLSETTIDLSTGRVLYRA